ncbi:MAG: cobaltochelatase subunit CobN [Lentisphaeria bacterium]|nr:cobaltochelatase subunit CobN [Lentisphaeria bacterium]
MKRLSLILLLLLAVLLPGASVVYLGLASDSRPANEAAKTLKLPAHITLEFLFTGIDPEEKIISAARKADLLILNARSAKLREVAEKHVDHKKTRLYAATSRLLKKEIPAQEPPEMKAYWRNRTGENFGNMLRWIIGREFKVRMRPAAATGIAACGATHPAAKRHFASIGEYRKWAESKNFWKPGAPLVALAVHQANVNEDGLALFEHLTCACEKEGLNTVIVFGDEVKVIRELLLTPEGKRLVDGVLALSFKFRSGLNPALAAAIRELDLPIFNVLRLYRQTTEEWRDSPRGMNDFSVAFGFVAPELSGLIEPSLLFGNRNVPSPGGGKIQIDEPFPDRIRSAAARMKQWIALRRKANAEKKIALFVYNGAGGKQNIGASGLNVPRSLVRILAELHRKGYDTGGLEKLTEKELTRALLAHARNVGPWAPGELEELVAGGEAFLLSLPVYEGLFAKLPEPFRKSVTAEWGQAGKDRSMFLKGNFVIPMLRRGNVAILPEPMRGWLGDPHKLVHSKTLAPPHQYAAVYLWLQHIFKADALIHLGRHGTSEWLPGKQLGLDAADAPLVLRGNIPEIYPYISDGIGEGIVAKRRAQAVMIDHLVPFLKRSSDVKLLPELREKLGACQSADPNVLAQRRQALRETALRAGLLRRLRMEEPGWYHRLEDYVESASAPSPFGLHTFGQAPEEPELRALLAQMPEKERKRARRHLANAGRDELNALLRALDGRFILPGESGDVLRNPGVLPVGRNFHAFDPTRIPTPEAMARGEKLATDLLARERERLGRFPRTAAVLLWAGESVRTDGLDEALALALMGMKLRHDGTGKIVGVAPVPGAALDRPRIDVLITTSGAYRDQFGAQIRLLEEARRQAARLRDAENFIDARRPGVFFPAPGTYGTRVNRLAGASGLWEKEEELAALYLRNMAWTTDGKRGFANAPEALVSGVKEVETLLHSRSSNVYGVTDIDEMYQYMGGLSLAVGSRSGKRPRSYIADHRQKDAVRVTGIESFTAAELDARLYSREWLARTMKEEYAGAKLLSRMTDNLWGWQAVTKEVVSPSDWETLNDIFVKDRYNLNMKAFFDRTSPWAHQSITGRMLESVRKGFWQPPEAVRRELAATYARSVVAHGMACCDHTCNNPLLNQMVVSLISLPGVLSPEMVMKFQVAVEKTGGKTLDRQVSERRELQKSLAPAPGTPAAPRPKMEDSPRKERRETASEKAAAKPVKGFRMKEKEDQPKETSLSSSGLKWTILAGVVLAIVIFALGGLRKEG